MVFTYPPYLRASKKLQSRMLAPQNIGFYTQEEAKERGMRLVICKKEEEHFKVAFFCLVDEGDGVIAEARFQVKGSSFLVGIGDMACEAILRKNYDQVHRLRSELLDKPLQDKNGMSAIPDEAYPCVELVLKALQEIEPQCSDISLSPSYVTPNMDASLQGSLYPDWDSFALEQKLAAINQVIEEDILPYIELDAGGVKVLELKDGREVIIAYEGSCTSCYSATGATLNAIQQILRSKIHPDLTVTPDMSFLQTEDARS